jgi:hypothetical protein
MEQVLLLPHSTWHERASAWGAPVQAGANKNFRNAKATVKNAYDDARAKTT